MESKYQKLATARIYEVNKDGKDLKQLSVDCMFNPYEYTVSKSNSYSEKPRNRSKTPQFEFAKAGSQTLKLNLIFDTYEAEEDVSKITRNLWKFMEPKTAEGGNKKAEPPQVAFEWGVFKFVAVITSMTQKFTLFTREGTPVRANVDVTFTQHIDRNDYDKQNPTSGGGPVKQVRTVVKGDRLDMIAADVYGDATRWRTIAEFNQISNPLSLRPGQELVIPVNVS